MPNVRVDDCGTVGVIKDVPAYELPPNAWTAATNVRMQDGSAHKALGYSELFASPPAVAPYFLYPVQTPSAFYWLYCGLNQVYAIQNQYHFELTRETENYNAGVYWRWNGTNLGGVIILNNGVDVPQFWSFPASHGNRLQDLTNWPATDRCKVMRAYKNYLIAANVERSGTEYPAMVKWSHRADIGAVPSSWAIDDATIDAGESILPNEGSLVDQLGLRDINVLYRTGSTWAMQFVGGNEIFRFWEIFTNTGLLSVDCVKEFYGSHFVVTEDDIIVHDGQNVRSVANNRVRRHIFSDVDTSNYDRSFVAHNRGDKEMWFCYPKSGSTLPDRAWVWSYADDSWSPRELPSVSHINYGVVDSEATDTWASPRGRWSEQSLTWASSSLSWAIDDVTWDADDKPWDYRTYDAQLLSPVYADATNVKLFKGDDSNTEDGTAMTSTIERTGLALIGPGKTDLFSRKQVRGLYPHIEGTNGGVVNCYVGTQGAIDETVTWSTAKPYTIGTSYKISVRADGRLIGVRFQSTTDIEWRLHGYQLDIEVSGER